MLFNFLEMLLLHLPKNLGVSVPLRINGSGCDSEPPLFIDNSLNKTKGVCVALNLSVTGYHMHFFKKLGVALLRV